MNTFCSSKRAGQAPAAYLRDGGCDGWVAGQVEWLGRGRHSSIGISGLGVGKPDGCLLPNPNHPTSCPAPPAPGPHHAHSLRLFGSQVAHALAPHVHALAPHVKPHRSAGGAHHVGAAGSEHAAAAAHIQKLPVGGWVGGETETPGVCAAATKCRCAVPTQPLRPRPCPTPPSHRTLCPGCSCSASSTVACMWGALMLKSEPGGGGRGIAVSMAVSMRAFWALRALEVAPPWMQSRIGPALVAHPHHALPPESARPLVPPPGAPPAQTGLERTA